MSRIDEVLERHELVARPPVLVDIGASGELPKEWAPIARYSICVAFDADERDFGAHVSRAHPYRKLYLHDNIVSDRTDGELDFHLTHSPYCSSALPPDAEALSAWVFADLFDVEKTVRLKARTLPAILRERDLDYVDWFKTDSQGTDLRLFTSLGDAVLRKVLAASFEPGIIDAYRGEDKLHAVLAAMDKLPFWMHHLEVRGTQRLSRQLWEERVRQLTKGALPLGLKQSPGWVEASYLNTLAAFDDFELRDVLLAWVFATLQEQHGFALELAVKAQARWQDPLLGALAEDSLSSTVGLADRMLPDVAKRAIRAARDLGSRLLRR